MFLFNSGHCNIDVSIPKSFLTIGKDKVSIRVKIDNSEAGRTLRKVKVAVW